MYRVLTYIFVFLACASYGQDISVSAHADTAQILLGDHYTYQLRVRIPRGHKVVLPPTNKLFRNDTFEVLSVSKTDTLLAVDKTILSKEYTVTSYYPGNYQMPEVKVRVITPEDEVITAVGPKVPMLVTGLPTRPQVIAPAKPIETTAFEKSYLKEIILGSILLLILLLSVILIYKLLKKKKDVIPQEDIPFVPVIPPYEKAIQALAALKEEDLLGQGKIKKFQSKLSIILRRYIEEQFDIPSLGMTTTETVNALQKHSLLNKHSNSLRDIFTTSDMVKFAKAKPTEEVNSKLFSDANSFVLSTKPVEKDEEDVD